MECKQMEGTPSSEKKKENKYVKRDQGKTEPIDRENQGKLGKFSWKSMWTKLSRVKMIWKEKRKRKARVLELI